jgi:hypothetical protein
VSVSAKDYCDLEGPHVKLTKLHKKVSCWNLQDGLQDGHMSKWFSYLQGEVMMSDDDESDRTADFIIITPTVLRLPNGPNM